MQSASIVAQSITIERFPPASLGALRMPLAERALSNAVEIESLIFPLRSSLVFGKEKIDDILSEMK